MRTIESYELVLTAEEDRLLLTYDWEDLPYTPSSVSKAVYDFVQREFRITFEDNERLEEVRFLNVQAPLLELVKKSSRWCQSSVCLTKLKYFARFLWNTSSPRQRDCPR